MNFIHLFIIPRSSDSCIIMRKASLYPVFLFSKTQHHSFIHVGSWVPSCGCDEPDLIVVKAPPLNGKLVKSAMKKGLVDFEA